MDMIPMAELATRLVRATGESKPQVDRFLHGLRQTLEEQLASADTDQPPSEVFVSLEHPILDLLPDEAVIDYSSAASGLAPATVREYIQTLESSILIPRLEHMRQPLLLEDLGVFEAGAVDLVYKPLAPTYAT